MKKVGWGWQRTLLLSAIPLTRVYGQNGTCRGKRDTEGERDFISIQLDARRNALEVRSGIAYEHTRCFILIKTPMYVHAIPLDNELDALCYAYVRACYSAVQRTLRSTRSSSYAMRMYVDAILLYNELYALRGHPPMLCVCTWMLFCCTTNRKGQHCMSWLCTVYIGIPLVLDPNRTNPSLRPCANNTNIWKLVVITGSQVRGHKGHKCPPSRFT